MVTSFPFLASVIDYPDSDGLPMAESDAARDYLIYGVEALGIYFQDDSQVYVSGNIFVYYEEGNPKSVVSPDVLVVMGVEKKQRRSYKTWEEGDKFPDFVLEITSKSTVHEDQGAKKGLYAHLGAKEYFQYDPTSDYLKPALQGFRLIEGNYLAIPAQISDDAIALFSQVLGLELRLENGEMRFYDPKTSKKLRSHSESEQALKESEQARLKAEQETLAALEKARQLEDHLKALGIDP
jgi:Uma2 family endonuclease